VANGATAAHINGISVNAKGATRPISLTANGVIQAQVSNSVGRTLCSSPTVVVTTPDPLPGSLVPSCTLVASQTTVVPGDSITLELRISRIATSATIHGAAVTIPATGNPSRTLTPAATTTFNATVTGGGGTSSCSLAVSLKATNLLTKEEFYRAKLLPGNLSVDDLLTRGRRSSTSADGGGCIACHASNGSGSFSQARLYFTLVAGDPAGNYTKLRSIPSATVPNITVPASRDLHDIVSLNVHYRATSRTIGGGGDDDNHTIIWSQVEYHKFTAAEITHISNFINKP